MKTINNINNTVKKGIIMKWIGKEEKINGVWYSVTVEADTLKEANKKLFKGQKKSYGIVEDIRGRWIKDI